MFHDSLDSDTARVALARRFLEMHNRGEYYSVPELLHPDFVFVPATAESWTPAGAHFHGHDGWRSMMDAMNVRERGYRNELIPRAMGDRVLATGPVYREEEDGGWSKREGALIFTFRENLIGYLQGFLSEGDAVESLADLLRGDGKLTKRQREIFTLLAQGLNGPEIAGRLGISPATVRTHVGNAMVALEVKTRAQAVAEALRLGEINL